MKQQFMLLAFKFCRFSRGKDVFNAIFRCSNIQMGIQPEGTIANLKSILFQMFHGA